MSSLDPKKLPWIEKYRPKHFNQIIDHQEKITTIQNLISKKELPHMLFYGPPGTGKTSVVLAIARALYGDDKYKMYILEINASGDRGIDTVRNVIINFAKGKSDKVKLVILDEADAMTTDAQNALRGVIEKYSKNCRFCLICNNINKINSAIKSRCTPMRFGSLSPDEVEKKITYIIEKESISINDKAIKLLINLESDFRKVINYLQGLHFLHSNTNKNVVINEEHIYKFLGKPHPEDIDKVVNVLFKGTFNQANSVLLDMYRSNKWNMLDMITYLLKKLLLLNIPIDEKHFLIGKLAEIEYRIKASRGTEIQIAYLASCFTLARKRIGKKTD